MQVPVLTTVRAEQAETAIVFIHGFGGNPATTWAGFPGFLRDEKRLAGWDIFTVGYASRLVPDIVGIWSADAPLETLSIFLKTVLVEGAPGRCRGLVLIAHSMGGLITQRALLDYPEVASKVTNVFLFGTPSAGLVKAGPFGFLKRQTRDMGEKSEFVQDLRARWKSKFDATTAFKFRTIAGDQDEFVPASSSLKPFPLDQQSVVAGNHLSIVKPGSTIDLGLEIVINGIIGNAAPAGLRNSARVAAESRNFWNTIQLLEPNKEDLDPPAAVALALAYEETGRQADAIALLEAYAARAGSKTDPVGVLAGRLKRRWLVERRRPDAERALQLYKQAFSMAVQNDDPAQAFYLGINVAFMELAYGSDDTAAKVAASQVLEQCRLAKADFWRFASEADAHLILGNVDDAIKLYNQALTLNPQPRELKSMCQQALRLADLLNEQAAYQRIEAISRGDELSSV